MSLPIRFTVCTYNLWGTTRWNERASSLESFLEYHQPDILCLQELHPESRQLLDKVLTPTHARVEDNFKGWEWEGNIYWNNTLFKLVEHGAVKIGQLEEFRRLFWVRLNIPANDNQSVLVSTAHFTWPGNEFEKKGGGNLRIPQAQKTVVALQELSRPGEAVLFMGDLNDQLHVLSILETGGFKDSFSALGRTARPTWPALPTATGVPFAIDWIFHKGAIHPMATEVVDFYLNDIAPSDHKAVMAVYRLANLAIEVRRA